MSIYATVTAKAAPGQMAAAMQWALEVRDWLNDNLSLGIEVLTNIGADAWTFHWVAKYDSIAQWDETYGKIWANEDYHALVKKADEAGLISEVTTSFNRIAP